MFYGGAVLYFHVGVAAGYGASLRWGTRSIWLCALPLLGTAALIETSRRVPAAETAAAAAETTAEAAETTTAESEAASEETEAESGSEESVSGAEETSAEESASQEAAGGEGKTLVVYDSATGKPKEVANYIANATGGDLFELEPTEPYTDEDLDWTNDNSRVTMEPDNPDQRQPG